MEAGPVRPPPRPESPRAAAAPRPPRAAVGPDLTQVFVGSEGTLGVICGARLRAHPLLGGEHRPAWAFASFVDGPDTCRRVRRGVVPLPI